MLRRTVGIVFQVTEVTVRTEKRSEPDIKNWNLFSHGDYNTVVYINNSFNITLFNVHYIRVSHFTDNKCYFSETEIEITRVSFYLKNSNINYFSRL